jgi:Tfp pilus assembly protein PilN
MSEINLLPEDIHPKAKVYKLAGVVRRLSIVLAIVLVFSTSGAVVFYFINQEQIQKSQEKQDSLTTSINSMQGVEQKIVLLKDRADKIDAVRKADDTSKQVALLEEIGRSVPEGSALSSLTIAKGEVNESISIPDSPSFLKFISSLTQTSSFGSVVLDSLNYSDKEGYTLSIKYTF